MRLFVWGGRNLPPLGVHQPAEPNLLGRSSSDSIICARVCLQEAVTLWEALRPSSTSAEEKAALVTQILSKVRPGPCTQPHKHASAALQTQNTSRHSHRLRLLAPALRVTTAVLSIVVAAQLEGRLVELASNHKASRIIQFCAKYGNEQQRKDVMGQVCHCCLRQRSEITTPHACLCTSVCAHAKPLTHRHCPTPVTVMVFHRAESNTHCNP